MSAKLFLIAALALLCVGAAVASTVEIESSLGDMLHESESHSMVQTMKIAARLSSSSDAAVSETERRAGVNRVVRLVKVLLARVQAQAAALRSEDATTGARCSKDIKALGKRQVALKHKLARSTEKLRIFRASHARYLDVSLDDKAKMAKLAARIQNLDNMLVKARSQWGASLIKLRDNAREIEDLIALLSMINKRLQAGNLVEVNAKLQEVVKARTAAAAATKTASASASASTDAASVTTMLELVADSALKHKAGDDVSTIRELVDVLIAQLRAELKGIQRLINTKDGDETDAKKLVRQELALVTARLETMQHHFDAAVKSRDETMLNIMSTEDNIKNSYLMMKSLRVQLNLQRKICGRGANPLLAAKRKQVKLLKKLLAVLGASDAQAAMNMMRALQSVDLALPVWKTGKWSKCSAACGVGIQKRSVQCTRNGVKAEGCAGHAAPVKSQKCSVRACQRDCQLSAWSAWSDCSAMCGGGVQTMQREILVEAQNGGRECPAEAALLRRRACNVKQCAFAVAANAGGFKSKKATRSAVAKKTKKAKKSKKSKKAVKKVAKVAQSTKAATAAQIAPPLKKRVQKRLNAFLDTEKGSAAADFCLSLRLDRAPNVFNRCLARLMNGQSQERVKKASQRLMRRLAAARNQK